MFEMLDCDALNAALAGTMFYGKLHIFQSIDSTNTLAMQEGASDAPHGSVYIAEEQTAGRGRGAHSWHSEPGAGLYVSSLLRPRVTPADGLWFSLATGLAVQQAIENVTEIVTDIRWPNDLLVGRRKVGGILLEMISEATRVRYGVVGIGLNVNHREFPPELSDVATSLRLEMGRAQSRQDLLIAILEVMQREIEPLMNAERFSGACDEIVARMERKSSWVRGKRVIVDEAGGYTGVTAGLDGNGFLLVQTKERLRTVLSGGVREDQEDILGPNHVTGD